MFTGIIEEIGQIACLSKKGEGYYIGIQTSSLILDNKLKTGDSVSANGICLTISSISGPVFYADLSEETFTKTAMRYSSKGTYVNLETPCRPDSLLSGHIISGHVDDTARVIRIERSGKYRTITFSTDDNKYNNLLLEKGSVSINGISLTIFNVQKNIFSSAIIPETIRRTNLQYLKTEDFVNIEFDIIGKYIIKWLEGRKSNNTDLGSLLKNSGFM